MGKTARDKREEIAVNWHPSGVDPRA